MMDPNATLNELIEVACRQTTGQDANRRRAALFAAIADDLCQWIGRGGFSPADPRCPDTLTTDADHD